LDADFERPHRCDRLNKDGNTALMWACKNNMEAVALKLLERQDIDINQENEDGYTALIFATENNMYSVISRITEITQ